MSQSINAALHIRYRELFRNLKDVVSASEHRVISEEPDELFSDNVNFFVKSYLISVCSYLEAYLQDLAYKHSQAISLRITEANIPHNFMHWMLKTKIKDKDKAYRNISLSANKKDISDEISANPYKTLKLFQSLGIDLSKQSDFENHKDILNTIVTKRNNIVHHNDTAADVSFGDLKSYIDIVIIYMDAVKKAVDEQAA